MSPERRAKLQRCLMRMANLTPCAHHVSPVVLEAQVQAMTNEELLATFQSYELIVDEAMGTDVG